MRSTRPVFQRLHAVCGLVLCLLLSLSLFAQAPPTPSLTATVPHLVQFSGMIKGADGTPGKGLVGITFALYRDEEGGAPLWLESQNVTLDASGHYSVMLGASTSGGLPIELFASKEAHWLGIEPQGLPAPARVLLLSVPYALKAGDAETIGGLPPSAFVRAASPTSSSSSDAQSSPASVPPPALGGGGTLDFIPLWTPDGSTLGNSALSQSGTGSSAKVGINTTSPSTTLDVKGTATIRGSFTLPATGTATATAGKNSQPLNSAASAFNSSTSTAVKQTFRWQAEPVGNNTPNASGSLNLLFAIGSATPAETGLNIASNGQIHFATGQTFPGTGTITGVTAGTDLTGGGNSGNVTLNLDTTKVPLLNAANTFSGNQSVTGNLTASGTVGGGVINAGTSFNLGGSPSAFGSNGNTFTGFAGNFTATGNLNTGSGAGALSSNTSGVGNTASGVGALNANTAGSNNTATGWDALLANSTGSFDTAVGSQSLPSSTSSYNTAIGAYSLNADTAGGANTAVGTNALKANITGSTNVASGYYSLSTNTSGSNNTADGWQALSNNITGSNNTAVGADAARTRAILVSPTRPPLAPMLKSLPATPWF